MSDNGLIQDADGMYVNLSIDGISESREGEIEDQTREGETGDQTQLRRSEDIEYYTQPGSNQSTMENMEYDETNTRAEKRLRAVDEEEIWTQVMRSGKKRIREGRNTTREIVENKIEVCITSKDSLPKQFTLARLLKAENMKNISKVKYINPFKIIITFENDEDASQLCVNKTFIDKGWKCQKTLEVGLSYGVLRDCEVELEEKEILESLSSPVADIIAVKRLNYRNTEGKWTPSGCVRVCFKGSTLPAFVYIHGIKTKVDQFKFPVTQCSKCWRFGHSGKLCPSRKLICPKCSDSHANCESREFKCPNCGGHHMAMFRGCPVFLKEKKIREIMAEFNCTYKMAVNMYVPLSSPTSPTRETPKTSTTTQLPVSPTPIVNTPIDIESQALPSGKTPQNRKNPTRKNTQKNITRTEPDWEIISEAVESTPSNVPSTEHETNETKKESDLLARLKEIIFMKRYDLVTKIKMAAQLIGEWILSYVIKNIQYLTFFKKIFDG